MDLYARAKAAPDAPAVVIVGGGARTRAELADRATRVAHALGVRGIEPGGRVALISKNRLEYVEVTLGAVLAGAWLTPISSHLKPDEIDYILRDSGARVCFLDPALRDVMPEAYAGEVIELGAPLDEALAEADTTPIDMGREPGGTMMYTGGTTGRPKGVQRGKAATLRETFDTWRNTAGLLGLPGAGPHLVTGPLYHAAPLLFALYDAEAGAPIHVMPRWDAAAALRRIDDERVTATHMVPTMFRRLLRLAEAERDAFDGSSLVTVLHGAAPIGRADKQAMIDWWGPKLVEYWGATEGGVYTLVDSDAWQARPGTVGRPFGAFEVFAVAHHSDARLDPGERGRLYCRHGRLAEPFRYFGDVEKTAEAYLEPHVFTAGDLGHVDEDGYVFLSERRSNLILSGGVNIYPAEIERVLEQHPDVADVAVIGVPDSEWGERVRAVVQLTPGATADDVTRAALVAWCREHLADLKTPRSVVFADALPRHPTGKLRVAEVRAKFGARD